MNIYIWIFTYSCPYSLDMHLRKWLTALSYDASRMHFLASDAVEMAPVCRKEWMDVELQMEVANAETTGRDHESVDEPWLLVTDTHLPCSQTVCFGFSELQWKPSCLPPNQWPNKSGWNYGKVNPDKNHSCALLQWKKRCHMSVSECVRDYCGLGMGCRWLEKQRGDCLKCTACKVFLSSSQEINVEARSEGIIIGQPNVCHLS